MSTKPVYVFAKWHVKEGNLQQVLNLLKEVITQSRDEEGNLLYNAHQSKTDANIIVIYEGYANDAALEAHRNSPHFQDIVLKKIVPLLAEREVVIAGDVW